MRLKNPSGIDSPDGFDKNEFLALIPILILIPTPTLLLALALGAGAIRRSLSGHPHR
ncbi:hypothetical protein SDC9_05336 [bioreactor metagenome]|jgi:hypothetical protein|uniref:Uncharacterized protein n=2 Tax=root TaxID=1 RepID=A0A652ZVA8_9SPIR|nr:hypothetical protein TRIP_E220005 [uncultured Spirochaetota bacterium]